MAKTEVYKDGVTLMAEAIRREQEEALKKVVTMPNVSDATVQFSNKSTQSLASKPEPKVEPQPDESAGEPDGTIYTDTEASNG